ncbi:unannotated protein [freshwater metagenome]|uniref:Unannotated protein n=1 Tax=freshwater metagenome TaxID=449393 RepID=A0A6J6RP44_9ZZZZ
MHVFDADRAAIGRAQHIEDRRKGHAVTAGESTGEEFAIEVPDRQSVGSRIEFGVQMMFGEIERIEIGIEVTANAEHIDKGSNLEVLFEHQLLVIVGVDVVSPFDWLVGETESFEDVLVKLVLAHEEFLDALEEKSRFGALNDAVVVRRGQGHDLRHA